MFDTKRQNSLHVLNVSPKKNLNSRPHPMLPIDNSCNVYPQHAFAFIYLKAIRK